MEKEFASLLEEFVCAVCFDSIQECHSTPCGHHFCKECIQEAINRRHKCPMCQNEVTQDQLLRNVHFDSLHAKFQHLRTAFHADYMATLASSSVPSAASPSSSAASPIEDVFRKHYALSVLPFQAHYTDLADRRQQRLHEYQLRLDQAMARAAPLLSASHLTMVQECVKWVVDAEGEEKESDERWSCLGSVSERQRECLDSLDTSLRDIASVHADFQRSVSSLVEMLQDHLSSVSSPTPSLLPIKATVRVENCHQKLSVVLNSTDRLSRVRSLLLQHMIGVGDPVEVGKDVFWRIRRPLQALREASEERNEHATVAMLRLSQGSELSLCGDVLLQSQKPSRCFSAEFALSKNTYDIRRVDYFRCEDCDVNWVCDVCSQHCHRGHSLQPFMMGHAPSYGCCYCVKKKKCVIENRRTLKKK